MAEKAFDVFLSYNRSDEPEVIELATQLKDRGLAVWLDKWELLPGERWQEKLEEIVERTKSAAVLVGYDGIGPWQKAEMYGCLSEFVDRGLPVIPVLLPNAPEQPQLPLFLRQFTWHDCRSGLTDDRADELVRAITRTKLGGAAALKKSQSDRVKRSRHRFFGLAAMAIIGAVLAFWGGEFLIERIGNNEPKEPDVVEPINTDTVEPVKTTTFENLLSEIEKRSQNQAELDRYLKQFEGKHVRLTSVFVLEGDADDRSYELAASENASGALETHMAFFAEDGGFIVEPDTGPKTIEGTLKKYTGVGLLFENCRFVDAHDGR